MSSSPPAHSSHVDRLYALPLSEFTAARNALAKELKSKDDRAGAARVAALAKPNLSSWAVNQIYWRRRPVFDALIEAGDRFRKAQSAHLTGRRAADLQEISRERQEALDAALKAGLEFLRESGSTASQMRDRIVRTLEAIAAYGRTSPEEARGRLSEDMNPPGFEALAALASGAGSPPPLRLVKPPARGTRQARSRRDTELAAARRRGKSASTEKRPTEREPVRQVRDAARLKEARSRLTREEAALRLRSGEAESASGRAREAARDEREAEAAVERASRDLERAEEELQKARAATKAAGSRAKQSAAALERAKRAAESARASVEKLEQGG
jgi:hypothetical protein